MKKLTAVFFFFVFVLFANGCLNEITASGKIIYFNTGTNNTFDYKLTYIVVSDNDKKIHLLAQKGIITELKNGDHVTVTYNRDTIAITMEEIELEGKTFKGAIWKKIIAIKKD